MSVVRFRKSSVPAVGQWYGEIGEDSTKSVLRRFPQKHKMCSTCCGFYGPSFGQPLCHTCHAFLFPDDVNVPDGTYFLQDKTDSEDSGNEEPMDFYETLNQRQEQKPRVIIKRPRLDKLGECITALSCPRKKEVVDDGLVENLPTEVLSAIFSFLDDLTLWNCSQVCRQWSCVIKAQTSEEKWRIYTKKRWPLFKPSFIVPCWQIMYSKLAQSASCMQCLHQMTPRVVKQDMNLHNFFCSNEPSHFDHEYFSTGSDEKWRAVRIRNEVKSLRSDPPEGIEAVPLDQLHCHWQASITGPADSPYEGGNFFLHLQIPLNYPMRPPVVRFITKIFHPNVSRHGNIGIDSIHENWSLALTISKILISIQSLLTDPYCHVCMEPEVGRLYQENRALFDATARLWTVRYAMYHKRPPLLERQHFLSAPENR